MIDGVTVRRDDGGLGLGLGLGVGTRTGGRMATLADLVVRRGLGSGGAEALASMDVFMR